jgi:glycosyltransferase involved in cell wall biosynthesis
VGPCVSVIMTVRNGARYLPETLDALRRQTFEDYELVVNDNGSTDGTLEILARYAASDRRMRLLPGIAPGQATFTSGIRRALQEARAPFVAVNDCDDVPALTRIEKQVALLQARPELALVGSWFDNIDSQGHLIASHRLPEMRAEILDLYQYRNPIAHSSMMYRRDAVLAAGGYQELFTFASDFALQITLIAMGGEIAVVPETLIKIRLHEEQTSLMPGRRAQFYHEPLQVLSKASRLPGGSWHARLRGMLSRQKLALRYGLALWKEGQRVQAIASAAYWFFTALDAPSVFLVGRLAQERWKPAGQTK